METGLKDLVHVHLDLYQKQVLYVHIHTLVHQQKLFFLHCHYIDYKWNEVYF